MKKLSIEEARRIAIAAQGLSEKRPAKPTRAHLRKAIHRLGLLQLDFVNVLVPAHYLVPFSRLGPYDRTALHDVIYRTGEFTEQWAHEACVVPMHAWPLLEYRREAHRARPYSVDLRKHREYAAWVLEQVRQRGPLSASDLEGAGGGSGRLPGTWYRSQQRVLLEAHFGRGALAVKDRLPNFARVFDLAERCIPAEHHSRRLTPEQARAELLAHAARAHGVGTLADLGDYYRMRPAEARLALAALLEQGEVEPVAVEGWKEAAYLHRTALAARASTAARASMAPQAGLAAHAAKTPRSVAARGWTVDRVTADRVTARALLSPFDPLVWFRPRLERLFDFEYRIEIYTPAAQRRWGYYVLPFLLDDRLVARVDLKADRAAATLRALAVHYEKGVDKRRTREALGEELACVAGWLGLERVAFR